MYFIVKLKVKKMNRTKVMKNLNGLTAVGFLLIVSQRYGYTIEKVGYEKIARYLTELTGESVGYGSVRSYFYKIEELGYIQIDNKGGRNIRFTLIKDKVNKLLGIYE